MLAAARRSGQIELAIHALAALEGTERSSPRKLDDLRAGWDASAKFLSNVLAQLVRHGLVGSTRGQHGGYWLARPLDEIELIDVLVAIGPRPGPPGGVRSTPHWDLVAQRVRRGLERTTVAELVAEQRATAARGAGR